MKKLGLIIVAMAVSGICYAEGKPSGKAVQLTSKTQAKTVQATVAPERTPTGPNGFGAIKIGMTKEAIESLSEQDGIYLVEGMKPFEYKYVSPKPGEDMFVAQVVSPISSSPLKATFTFIEGELTVIVVNLGSDQSLYDKVEAQISEKYGKGREINGRKDEMCIYRNGSNFKLPNGDIRTKWVDSISASIDIETETLDLLINSCPSDLRHGTTGGVNMKSLSIKRIVKSAASGKSVNPF